MKISPFKLGLVLVIVGMVWTAFIFDETEKRYDSIILKQSNSFEVKSEFFGTDIGYYKLYMPEFEGEEIFVQILDTKENVIVEQIAKEEVPSGIKDMPKEKQEEFQKIMEGVNKEEPKAGSPGKTNLVTSPVTRLIIGLPSQFRPKR